MGAPRLGDGGSEVGRLFFAVGTNWLVIVCDLAYDVLVLWRPWPAARQTWVAKCNMKTRELLSILVIMTYYLHVIS